jgi:hypothetical protein
MNEFVEAREGLAAAIATLPPRLRENNAAQLFAIIEELRKSLVIELKVVQRVAAVNTADPVMIRELRQDIENYVQYRWFDGERTHCHNIDRVAREIRAENPAELTKLATLLAPLREADNDYLDDVERLLIEAISAITEIDDAVKLDDARGAQDRFRRQTQDEVASIKTTLSQMNKLAGELIDLV